MQRYRIQLTKKGPAAFLGHLEFGNVIRRALRSAGLPLKYSEGFHPHVKISFGKALPVGIESECEFVDVELIESMEPREIGARLKGAFPDGVGAVSVVELGTGSKSIENSVFATIYNVEGLEGLRDMSSIKEAFARFEGAKCLPFMRMRGGGSAEVDLKDFISELVIGSEGVVGLTLNERETMIRVSEALAGVFGLSDDLMRVLNVKKIAVDMRS